MRSLSKMAAGLVFAALAAAPLHTGLAQDKPAPKPNPVGAGWGGKVKPEPGTTTSTFDSKQVALIQKVSAYFNGMNLLQGRFEQTDADQKVTKGKLYIKRPGRFRFEYARPSRKVIVSDGRFLAIQDLDLNSEENVELDNTPFKVLLRKDVDLLRDAKIIAVAEIGTQIVLTLADKSPDAVGTITVTLDSAGGATKLTGWQTLDAQGLKTTVALSDVSTPEKLNDDLFKREKLFLKGLNPN